MARFPLWISPEKKVEKVSVRDGAQPKCSPEPAEMCDRARRGGREEWEFKSQVNIVTREGATLSELIVVVALSALKGKGPKQALPGTEREWT
jgi:hypothetical protein